MKPVGIGTRVISFLVDTLLIFLLSYFLYEIRMFYVRFYHFTFYPWYYYFWVVLVVYYIVFEALFARTPGKWLSISKVVNAQGKKPALWQVVVRSVVRVLPIDCFLIPFVDGTLHDYVSKTFVVEA